MFAIIIFYYLYVFITMYNIGIHIRTRMYTSTPCFVFGSNDPCEIVVNHTMISGMYAIPYTLSFTEDGFCYYYVNNRFQRILRNPFRKALRTHKIIQDHEVNESDSRLACSICSEYKSCILTQPCAHLGMCNRCCFQIFNKGFFTHIKTKERFVYEPKFDHRLYTSDSLDDAINNISIVKNKCPFCKIKVSDIQYVYLV